MRDLLLFMLFVSIPIATVEGETVLQQRVIERAVSLLFEVLEDGVIEGELVNTTTQRVSDVEVLVRYNWIWHRESTRERVDPSWSTTFTFPVELDPGQSSPLTIPPLRDVEVSDEGYFWITAKVMGYTRYRWVDPNETPNGL